MRGQAGARPPHTYPGGPGFMHRVGRPDVCEKICETRAPRLLTSGGPTSIDRVRPIPLPGDDMNEREDSTWRPTGMVGPLPWSQVAALALLVVAAYVLLAWVLPWLAG